MWTDGRTDRRTTTTTVSDHNTSPWAFGSGELIKHSLNQSQWWQGQSSKCFKRWADHSATHPLNLMSNISPKYSDRHDWANSLHPAHTASLRWMVTPGDLAPILHKGVNLWDLVSFLAFQSSSEKEAIPMEANSFLFRVDFISEGRQNIVDMLSSLKVYPFTLNLEPVT